MTISETLARFVADTAYGDLPQAAIRAAKRSLIDTFAVSLAARVAPGVREVVDLVIGEGGRAASSMWAAEGRVPPRAAAFANGFTASALDFDSLHPEAVVHADIVIVPTALAVSEDCGASGKQLLTAIAVGDDMLCRLAGATRLNSGWFYTSLYGPIASAAITARLLGAAPAHIAGAMGLGSMSAAGTQQPAVERSMGKRMQGALAGAAGVTAGYLGKSGIDGPKNIIEGRFGLHRMHEPGDPAIITKNLGSEFENTRISFKPFPSCQCNHAAIEGMLQLRQKHGVDHENVRSVEVFVSPYMQRLVGSAFAPEGNPQVAAQFSIQYSIASVLLFGRLGVPEISSNAVLDPRIAPLVRKIMVSVDESNANNYAPIRLRVATTSGAVIEHDVDKYCGSIEVPLTDAGLKEKLATCIEAGGHSVGTAQVDSFFEALMNVESETNVATFTRRILAPLFKGANQKNQPEGKFK